MTSGWAHSALDWWREAGVDVIVGETPHDWLNPPQPPPRSPAAAAAPAAKAEPLPDTLPALQAWLLASDALPLATPAARRVAPAGDPASGLMMMVDMPSVEDAAAGALLSGEVGALFDRMLAAIGRSRETIYLASLSPVRTASGRLNGASLAALADLARHHVGLAAPRALLLFGDACSKALVGPAVAGARGKWHELATPAGQVDTLVTLSPHKLLTQPTLKKHAWEDLQRLMEGLK
jgi:uracil-DNA glycosylase family 4